MTEKLHITKKDIGRKVFTIAKSEYTTKYYKVLANDEDQATDILYEAREISSQDKDEVMHFDEEILFEGCREEFDDIVVNEIDEITEDDFDKDPTLSDWYYEGEH